MLINNIDFALFIGRQIGNGNVVCHSKWRQQQFKLCAVLFQ